MSKPLVVTVIGGGSSYTPELLDGLIRRQETLPLKELRLVDIDEGRSKVEIIADLARRMFSHAGLSARVTATLERKQALDGADFVISQFRAGGLKARARDEHIPLKFGVVGQETTGPGGFMNALRTIPVALEVARDMKEVCPGAKLLNFTNPSGIVTEALNRFGPTPAVGLCNVPISMIRALAAGLKVAPQQLNCSFYGLNHLSFMYEAKLNGMDLLPELLKSDLLAGAIMENIPDLNLGQDFIRALGVIPSPYLRYFYFPEVMRREEEEAIKSGKGSRAEVVQRIEAELFAIYADAGTYKKPEQLSLRGGTWYSEVALITMEAMATNQPVIQVLNVPNRGAIPDLPYEAVVEINCVVDSRGALPVAAPPLPTAVCGLVQQMKAYEQLAAEAAVSCDRRRAFLALLNHPLVPGASTAHNLLEALLDANRSDLPAAWFER